MKKSLLLAAPSIAMGIAVMALPGIASAADTTSYQAQLDALNGSGASGSVMLQLNGDQATVTEEVSGLAGMFNGSPYPHVQHIHIGAKGECPTPAADTDGDGVISTTEGGPSYGAIGTTLSTSGDTSPAAGTTLEVAPSGDSYSYDRTLTLDAATLESLQAGTAVVVVHGLDPATLPAAAQSKPSDLVPSLPLAATSPALCGTLTASQMSSMPSGSAATGGGSTAGVEDQGLLALGGGLLAAGAVAGGLALRRRSATQA
ncbi:hypothetical protein [Modestobacter excelsi]|uniref:hypothetical protein n=1 Tax=Modestobacter excelsi TaxID=2213161 RepID=UPI00110CAB89|nr:hypothetical protein [Modestobacter excelsi]